MIGRSHDACASHQAALLDFAERLERTAGTPAALAHLERCRRCEDELAGIVRTLAGLRRLAEGVARVEPGQEVWPMLRERVTRREPGAWRGHQSLGGLMAMAVVALFVLPSIGGDPAVKQALPVEAPGQSVVEARYYESPAGALTAEMVNAIAGQDVSKRKGALGDLPHGAEQRRPRRTEPDVESSRTPRGWCRHARRHRPLVNRPSRRPPAGYPEPNEMVDERRPGTRQDRLPLDAQRLRATYNARTSATHRPSVRARAR